MVTLHGRHLVPRRKRRQAAAQACGEARVCQAVPPPMKLRRPFREAHHEAAQDIRQQKPVADLPQELTAAGLGCRPPGGERPQG